MRCLNPYSTGIRTEPAKDINGDPISAVLILILLEYGQNVRYASPLGEDNCLNPYSTGIRTERAE